MTNIINKIPIDRTRKKTMDKIDANRMPQMNISARAFAHPKSGVTQAKTANTI